MAIRCEKCGELIWASPEETVKQKVFICKLCGKVQDNTSFENIQSFITEELGNEED